MPETETTDSRSLRDSLFDPVDSSVLVWLRMAVGAAVFFWTDKYLAKSSGIPNWELIFTQPEFLFKYAGFEWVRLWPGDGIYWHFIVTKIAAACLVVGLLTRVSAFLVCFGIAYVLLVERLIYVNHYYLLSCAAAVLGFFPAANRYSLDCVLGIEKPKVTFARWQLWFLRFQLGMPYMFGAVAKLNWDWLVGCQPPGILLGLQADMPVIGPYLVMPGAKEMIAYGGIAFDALVVPMLLFSRTRWIGVAMSLGFHLTNATILNIGVFPWFMLATLVVFFPPKAAAAVMQRVGFPHAAKATANVGHRPSGFWSKLGLKIVILYVVIQLLLPWRPWVLPGNPSWNERGHRFAWRMMLRNKRWLTAFYIEHPETGNFLYAPSSIIMTPYQRSKAGRDPELIRQAAVQVKKRVAELGLPDSKVYALCLVSLNGRQPVPIVDPTIDLTQVKRGWFYDDWVQQDPGRFRAKPWMFARNDWWRTMSLPAPFKPLEKETPEALQRYVEKLGAAAQKDIATE